MQHQSRTTRDDDERLLTMLALRDRGVRSPQVGEQFGMRSNAVRTLFQRIERDLAASEAG